MKLSDLLSEAVYGSPIINPIDTDENQYRRLTQARRDLPIVEQTRMIEWAAYLYTHNPLARRLIEIQRDWCLGEGLSVTADDENVLKLMLAHWNNQTNDWTVKGEQRFNDLRLFGEACYPVAVSQGRGLVYLGVVDPSRIKAAVRDEQQIDQVDHVILNAAWTGGPEQRLKVIRENPSTHQLEDASDDDDPTRWDGSCFYFGINRVATASRGVSDLFALIDYIDAADQFLWTQVERAKLLNAQIFDVSVDGSPADVDKEEQRIRQKNPTRPGTVNVHTKSVTWEIKNPDLKAEDNSVLGKTILRWVAGGVGLPEAWFGTAEDSAGGALDSQTDPAIKRMTAIQKNWMSCINMVLRYQYEQAEKKGWPGLKPLEEGEPYPWRIEAPDMQVKDLAKLGAMINQLVVALSEAEQLKYVSTDTARRTFLSLLKLFGSDVNSQTELEKINSQPPPEYLQAKSQELSNGDGTATTTGAGGTNPNPTAALTRGSEGTPPTAAEKSVNGQNAYQNSRATEGKPMTVGSMDMELDEQTVVHKDTNKKRLRLKGVPADQGDDLPPYERVDDDGQAEGQHLPQYEGEQLAYKQPDDDFKPDIVDDDDESKTGKQKKTPRLKKQQLSAGLVVYRGLSETSTITENQVFSVGPFTAMLTPVIPGVTRVVKVTVTDGTRYAALDDGTVELPAGQLKFTGSETASFSGH